MAYRGNALRSLREQKKIQLRGISDETRINVWYLTAIEEERFDRFPGTFYFKSFTREYARALGLDPTEVVKDLEAAYDEWSRHRERAQRPVDPSVPGGFMARFKGWGGRLKRPPEV